MTIKVQVNSTAISSIQYNEEERILCIEFIHGATYEYPSVPKEEFINLIHAPSVGKYFNSHIRQYGIRH